MVAQKTKLKLPPQRSGDFTSFDKTKIHPSQKNVGELKSSAKNKLILLFLTFLAIVLRISFWQSFLSGNFPQTIYDELSLQRQSLGALPLFLSIPLIWYFYLGLAATILI